MDALARIKQIGMPRRNNELWTFFPVASIPNILSSIGDCHVPLQGPRNDKQDSFDIEHENDFAALLPIACNARPMVKDIVEDANEMAMVKCNSDFGHTVLNIGKNATASIEILDNKVTHEICAERFDIHVAENATVHVFFANPADPIPLRFRHFRITQAAGSKVYFSEIEQGNGTRRTSIDAFLEGPGAQLEVRALNILGGTDSVHHRLTIHHKAPETRSVQFARNLLSGNSRASYDGSVIVGDHCTKAFSSQLVNTILLSEDSSVSVKPVLKIYHDDVECTHGNTCGELDADQLFYLVSRGIPREKAKELLTNAFAKELFMAMEDSPAKKRLEQVVSAL